GRHAVPVHVAAGDAVAARPGADQASRRAGPGPGDGVLRGDRRGDLPGHGAAAEGPPPELVRPRPVLERGRPGAGGRRRAGRRDRGRAPPHLTACRAALPSVPRVDGTAGGGVPAGDAAAPPRGAPCPPGGPEAPPAGGTAAFASGARRSRSDRGRSRRRRRRKRPALAVTRRPTASACSQARSASRGPGGDAAKRLRLTRSASGLRCPCASSPAADAPNRATSCAVSVRAVDRPTSERWSRT